MKFSVKIAPEKRKDKTGQIISKNVPLFADMRFSNTRFFYFIGYRVNVNWDEQKKGSWDFSECKVRKNNSGFEGKESIQYGKINDRIDDIKTDLRRFFEGTNSAQKQEIISLLDATCKKAVKEESLSEVPETETIDFFSMFDKYMEVSKFSTERKRHVSSIKNQWQRYETKRGIKITFNLVTVDLLRDFEKFLRKEDKRLKTWNSKKMVLSPKGENTIHKIMAMTRAFWNFARKDFKQNGNEIHYPFGSEGYQVPGDVYGAPIYITKEERNKLFNATLESERLQRVRDIFVFQCLIGARVGDLCKLTKANVQNGILTYIPRKTKDGKPVAVTVPLSNNALEILTRYDMPDNTLLPFITDQRYNTYLKELFRKVEINRIVTRLNPTTGEPEQKKLSDIVSSHMARRAFIGNLYGKVDSGIISSMSGHIQGSKAFARYYDVSTELQQQAINLID